MIKGSKRGIKSRVSKSSNKSTKKLAKKGTKKSKTRTESKVSRVSKVKFPKKSKSVKTKKPVIKKGKPGRPKLKRPRKADAKVIDTHDEFYHPPESKKIIRNDILLGFCPCGSIIISSDKRGRRYLCNGCGNLILKSSLSTEKSHARNAIDDIDDTDEDEGHKIIHKHLNSKRGNIDDDNPHGKMLEQ